MKTLLIYPFLDNPNVSPPMGILSLGTYLRKFGNDVKLLDLSFSKDFLELERALREYAPDIVGISLMTIFSKHLPVLSEMTKKICPNSLLVCGGPHVTAMPREVLDISGVDACCIGEGEKTMLDLVCCLGSDTKEWRAVKGLAFKGANGEIVQTERQEYIADLDELGSPDRSLLSTFPKYLEHPAPFPFFMPSTYILSARGCPYNCSFCQPMLSLQFGKKVRRRSVESVVDEMDHLVKNYHVKSIYFADETFLADRRWAADLCSMIKRRGLEKRIKWLMQTNVLTFDEESARMIKDAGCIMTIFGVESGSEKILREVYCKHQTREKISEVFRIAKRHGLLTEASLIVGAVEDSTQTLEETVSLVEEIGADFLDIHYLTPTPGSELFERYKRCGVLKYSNLAEPDRYTPGLLKYETLKPEEIISFRDKIQERHAVHHHFFSKTTLLRLAFCLNLWHNSAGHNPARLLKILMLNAFIPQSCILNKSWTKYCRFRESKKSCGVVGHFVNNTLDLFLKLFR